MRKGKIDIWIENFEHFTEDEAYIALAMKGGFAARKFWVGEKIFEGSYAFCNTLVSYLKLSYPETTFDATVLTASTYFTLKESADHAAEAVRKLLNQLLSLELDRDRFEEAKALCRQRFAANYKKESFRARLLALEYTEYQKDFHLRDLIRDIDEISFEEFQQNAAKLLVPANIAVFIIGKNVSQEPFQAVFSEWTGRNTEEITLAAYDKDLTLRADAHSLMLGKSVFACSAIAFSFLNEKADSMSRMLLLSYLREMQKAENVFFSFDIYDAGMILENEDLKSKKELYRKRISQQEFEDLKKQQIDRYATMVHNLPLLMAAEAANMKLCEIDLMELIDAIRNCTYEQFLELYRASGLLITEAQVLTGNGGGSHEQQ